MNYTSTVIDLIDNIWVKNNTEIISQLYHPLAIIDSPLRLTMGQQGKIDIIRAWHAGFNNIDVTIHDTICENQKVFVNWTCHGTHEGSFLNIAPTGRRIIYNGFNLFHFVDNKIQRYQSVVNLCAIYEQMGVDLTKLVSPLTCRNNEATLIQEINKIKGLEKLTMLEIQCISLWINHRNSQEISAMLNIPTRVLNAINGRLKEKLAIQSKSQLNDYFKNAGAAHLLQHYSEYLLKQHSNQTA